MGVWKSAIIRFHLYEIAARHDREFFIARFDSRGIRSPLHMVRIPFAELTKADWELPNTDMLVWIWQAVREYSSPYRPNIPFRLDSPTPDLQNLIYSTRKRDINSTQVATDYGGLKSALGLNTSSGRLSTSCKGDVLSRPGASPMVIIRLLNLGAQRHTLRAFAGP